MIVGDRRDEVNYEKNGSREENKEAKQQAEKSKPWPLEVIGLGVGLHRGERQATIDQLKESGTLPADFGTPEQPADKET